MSALSCHKAKFFLVSIYHYRICLFVCHFYTCCQLVYTIGKTVLFICNNGVLYGFTHFYYMVNILKTSQIIKGRPDMLYAFLTYMGVDFRGPATFMPQQFLNIPQICPALQQMGGIRVP